MKKLISFLSLGALMLGLALSAACDNRNGNNPYPGGWLPGGGSGGYGGYNPNDPNQWRGRLRISQNAKDYRDLLKAVGTCSPWCKSVDAPPTVVLRFRPNRLPAQGMVEIYPTNSPNSWVRSSNNIVYVGGRFDELEGSTGDTPILRAEQYSADVTIDLQRTEANSNCFNLSIYHEGVDEEHKVLKGRVCRHARRR